MGLWSAAKSFAGKVASGAKKVAKKAKDTVKKGAKKVKDTVKKGVEKAKKKANKTWASFTGKDKADKAKKIFNKAKSKYKEAKNNFDKKSKKLIKEINSNLTEINRMKEQSYDELFASYGEIVSRMKNFKLSSEEILDGQFNFDFELEDLKNTGQVIKIDFDKNAFTNNLKAIFTLGFHTRKKAKKSLEKAKNEKHKAEMKIKKMKAELSRLERVRDAVANIKKYFVDLTDIFVNLLERLNYSLDSLKKKHIILSYSFAKGKLDYKKLPRAQMKTFEVTTTLVKVLAAMSQKNYIKTQNQKIKLIEEDVQDTEDKLKETNIQNRAVQVA